MLSALASTLVLVACVPAPDEPPADPPPAPGPDPAPGEPGPDPDGWEQNGSFGDCPAFPDDNPWNTPVDGAPVHPESAAILGHIAAHGGDHLHPDFGGDGAYGIPYVSVPGDQQRLPITFTAYGDESDPGPYPIPLGAPIEGGSDRHVLAVDRDRCRLYELYRAFPTTSGWEADSGATWDLRSNALRPAGWTSADAAGLPILPGLVRYDEVAAGEIDHALRVTFAVTRRAYISPARHWASSVSDPAAPPMGLRLRLRADFDRSAYTGQARVVLDALARYGMLVADNGSNWFVTGAADARWDDDDLAQLKSVSGSAFEVVDTGPPVTP